MTKLIYLFLINLTVLNVYALNIHSGMDLVGKPIKSSLLDQVCHIDIQIDGNAFICSAVRISSDYVLTAEHCARDVDGNVGRLTLECNGEQMTIAKVYESKIFIDGVSKNKDNFISSNDFSILKIKNPKTFVPKFKLSKNLEEMKNIFFNESSSNEAQFNENTYCEFHGYGEDARGSSDKLNSTSIETTSLFDNLPYEMKAIFSDGNAYMESPLLPERDIKNRNEYSPTARPGDSGGPLFCKSHSGDFYLSGIASVLQSGECSKKFPDQIARFGSKKVTCFNNRWGIPTADYLEKIFNIKID